MYSDPNPPQSLPTEANLQAHATTNITHVSEPEPRSSPPTLIALLIFLVLQLLSAIAYITSYPLKSEHLCTYCKAYAC